MRLLDHCLSSHSFQENISFYLIEQKVKKKFILFFPILGGKIELLPIEKHFFQEQECLLQILKSVSIFEGIVFKGERIYEKRGDPVVLKLEIISSITFKKLQILDFSYCNIASIQVLGWLDIDKVQTIVLRQNNITSLMPFQKTKLNQLKMLALSLNKFSGNQLISLQRCYCPKINFVSMNRRQFSNKSRSQLIDLKVMCRMQMNQQTEYRENQRGQKINLKVGCDFFEDDNSKKSLWIEHIGNEAFIKFIQHLVDDI